MHNTFYGQKTKIKWFFILLVIKSPIKRIKYYVFQMRIYTQVSKFILIFVMILSIVDEDGV